MIEYLNIQHFGFSSISWTPVPRGYATYYPRPKDFETYYFRVDGIIYKEYTDEVHQKFIWMKLQE